jgi:hypothetical protein
MGGAGTAPPVSVIVVSRGRPALLHRCLTGIGQLWYPAFEVVVVADTAGCDTVATMGWADRVLCLPFDTPNISAARNLGIAESGGEIVAFIDDDAVPEPTWLDHLCAPFADPEVAQTGGYVRARNGISLQWGARAVDRQGRARRLAVADEAPFTPRLGDDEAAKTEGTNMAFRRAVIAATGGFDPAFSFYLDETDVNLRLRARKTVIVPRAQVHHGFAPSRMRKANRGVTDLSEVGASTAVFLRKHGSAESLELGRNRLFSNQHRRLIEQMVQGVIEPGDVAPLMAGLSRGFEDGLTRTLTPLSPIPDGPAFRPFPSRMSGQSRVIAGRPWRRRRLAADARASVAEGDVTTVLTLSPTTLAHRATFSPDGFWRQWGGVFGRTDRAGPRFRWTSFAERVRKEEACISDLRRK